MVNLLGPITSTFVSKYNQSSLIMKGYLFLIIAIAFETLGTSMLKASEQFTKLIPSAIAIAAYIGTFYFLSLTLKTMPVGIAYGIWGGVGIVLITIIGILVFKQDPMHQPYWVFCS